MELHGDFTTGDPSSGSTPTGRQRRSIMFLRTAEADARDAHRAAGWGWVPTLALSGGLLISETTDTRYGYVAGLSLSLPIFSWGQELRAESSARQQLAAAEVRSAERATRLEEVRAREQLVSVRQEITRFSEATGDRVDVLERAVQSGYREGDRTVVELLDAQRARTDVDRRRLALEFLAKLAEIDLRAARGEFE
jgi:cobalt-zinc-cadmium efflux system outer membrane protein